MTLVLDALSTGSLYALMALGIALLFGVMRLINFAYGEVIMLCAYTLYLCRDLSWLVFVPVVFAVGFFVALAMERVAFRPLRQADPTTLLVGSFALSITIQNATSYLAGEQSKGVDVLPALSEPVSLAGGQIPLLNLVTIATTLTLLVVFTLLIRRTTIGLQVQAAAEDFPMARLLGVRANRVIAVSFATSGIFAAAVAILLVASSGSVSPSMGFGPALVGFVAVVIGGMGSLSGAALGGFTLGALSILLQSELPESARPYRDALIYGIVIVILLVRPEGLMGNRALRERV